jgi:hypothetical protein
MKILYFNKNLKKLLLIIIILFLSIFLFFVLFYLFNKNEYNNKTSNKERITFLSKKPEILEEKNGKTRNYLYLLQNQKVKYFKKNNLLEVFFYEHPKLDKQVFDIRNKRVIEQYEKSGNIYKFFPKTGKIHEVRHNNIYESYDPKGRMILQFDIQRENVIADKPSDSLKPIQKWNPENIIIKENNEEILRILNNPEILEFLEKAQKQEETQNLNKNNIMDKQQEETQNLNKNNIMDKQQEEMLNLDKTSTFEHKSINISEEEYNDFLIEKDISTNMFDEIKEKIQSEKNPKEVINEEKIHKKVNFDQHPKIFKNSFMEDLLDQRKKQKYTEKINYFKTKKIFSTRKKGSSIIPGLIHLGSLIKKIF